MITYIAYDIEWDTDDYVKPKYLPNKTTIRLDNEADPEYDLTDALSDKYGWCVLGCKYRRK
jgi:hypothetical protein